MNISIKNFFRTIKLTQYGCWWGHSHGEVYRYNNIYSSLKPSHMEVTSLCLEYKVTMQIIWITRVVKPLMCKDLSWSLTILFKLSVSGTQPINWKCLTSIPCGVLQKVTHSYIYDGRHNKTQLDISFSTHLINQCTIRYWSQGYMAHSRYWR